MVQRFSVPKIEPLQITADYFHFYFTVFFTLLFHFYSSELSIKAEGKKKQQIIFRFFFLLQQQQQQTKQKKMSIFTN